MHRIQTLSFGASRFALGVLVSLGLLCPAAAWTQSICATTFTPGGKRLTEIIAAVNDGRPNTINTIVESDYAPSALGNGQKSELVYDLGVWHWRSHRLDPQLLCTVSSSIAFALVRNELSEEIDSLHVQLDSASGRILRHFVSAGVRTFATPTDFISDSARIDAVRRIARKLVNAGVFAGIILVARNGRPAYIDTVGEADLKRHTPTRFNAQYSIASMGKIFTATALMQLVHAQRIHLDDPIGSLLPDSIESPSGTYFRLPQQVRAVQLKHVLTHTSGIEPGQDTLSFRPGSRFEYSNFGFYLLGRALEHVTGVPLETSFKTMIFDPAGMTATRRLVTKNLIDSLPPNNMVDFDSSGFHFTVNPLIQTISASGAGNFFSTASDILRFSEALRTGRLLPLDFVDLMRAPKPELGAPQYGFGVVRWRGPGVWGHAGSLPGVDADLELYGDTGWTLVILSNRDGVNGPIRRKMEAVMTDRIYFNAP